MIILLPITYELKYNSEGEFTHFEMVQGQNRIAMSFALPNQAQHSGYKWGEVKASVDLLLRKVRLHLETTSTLNKDK